MQIHSLLAMLEGLAVFLPWLSDFMLPWVLRENPYLDHLVTGQNSSVATAVSTTEPLQERFPLLDNVSCLFCFHAKEIYSVEGKFFFSRWAEVERLK